MDHRKVQNKGSFDVIVVGGGIAGIAASVSAARQGMSVLLLEKSINLGGLATTGLISWYEPLCDGLGNQMVSGIAEELIRLAAAYCFDTLPRRWGGSGACAKPDGRYATYFSPTVFSLALDDYVLKNGVTLRFDTYGVCPVMEGTVCAGILCESESGREFFKGRMIIDTTGSASVMHRAGVPTVEGRNYFSYIAHYFTRDMVRHLTDTHELSDLRKWKFIGSDMCGRGQPEDLPLISGTTAEDVTRFVNRGKRELFEFVRSQDKRSFDVMALPAMPQLRTIRRIVGERNFCGIDREFAPDSIGCCGDFRAEKVGRQYEIPYGALYSGKAANMLAAGRIISATQGDGWEVSRVIPICALTGQAAGHAAALAIRDSCVVSQVDVGRLQALQENAGTIPHWNDHQKRV